MNRCPFDSVLRKVENTSASILAFLTRGSSVLSSVFGKYLQIALLLCNVLASLLAQSLPSTWIFPPMLIKELPALLFNVFIYFYPELNCLLGWSKLFSEVPILFLLVICSQSCICFEWSPRTNFPTSPIILGMSFCLPCEDYRMHISSHMI